MSNEPQKEPVTLDTAIDNCDSVWDLVGLKASKGPISIEVKGVTPLDEGGYRVGYSYSGNGVIAGIGHVRVGEDIPPREALEQACEDGYVASTTEEAIVFPWEF